MVLSNRERLVLVRPLGRLLAMSTLVYDAQVNQPERFEGLFESLGFKRGQPAADFEVGGRKVEEICQQVVFHCVDQAATSVCLMPSMNGIPCMTSRIKDEPFSARHFLLADSVSLKTMARQATRLPLPRVFF